MKVPEFTNEQELAEFWDKHDSAEYAEGLEEVHITWEPDEGTCPRCSGEVNLVTVDIELTGNLILQGAMRYECPTCGYIGFSPQTVKAMSELEQKIRRYGVAGLILLNRAHLEPASQP